MTETQTWYCKNCPMTNNDCGEYSEDSNYFNRVKQIHKEHSGWQVGKPEPFKKESEIEKLFTKTAKNLAENGAFSKDKLNSKEEKTPESISKPTQSIIKLNTKSHEDVLDYIVEISSKEIKEEDLNIQQIALTIFSSYTENPMNLRILAPSGEGKTYLVTQIAKLFPQDNIITLAKATPQSFKYALTSKQVVENGAGNWQDYDIAVQPLEEDLINTRDKEKQQELKKQIKELRESSCSLVDFSNKTIILVDSQSFELFESIKTTLSHDQKQIQSFSVNKSKSGTILGQKFVIRGFPAVIYCSAKDEQKRDETNEINTRFNTISLNTSTQKYKKMLDFEATKSSLPDFIYQEEIVSEEDFDELKEEVLQLTKKIKCDNETVNPYAKGISALMRSDAGFRTRQLKILNNNIRMHTLVNAHNRPRLVYEENRFPITTRLDIEQSCLFTKEPLEIQTYKIKVFNDLIRPALLDADTQKSLTEKQRGLTASELVEVLQKTNSTLDRQRLQETILKPLVEHGFLENAIDQNNKTRHVYYLPDRYVTNNASLESTLIDVSALDTSCVDSYVNQYLKQRFENDEISFEDDKGNPINIERLLELLHTIDTEHTQNRHKSDNVDSTKNNEDES